jgi:hypothetical protein
VEEQDRVAIALELEHPSAEPGQLDSVLKQGLDHLGGAGWL